MLIEEYDEPEYAPCPICESDDHEEVLILCDGCDRGYHTYCVDLDAVPRGAWFCDDCATTRAIESVAGLPTTYHPGSQRTSDIRTRDQLRQQRHRNQMASSDWARVWQTVNDSVNIDLDFPFYALAPSRTPRSRNRQAPSRRLWERRLQVARQQGASDQLEEAAAVLIDRPAASRPRPDTPEHESMDELLSWNAFEKARDIEADPRPKTRKRKSATTSPSDADAQPRRKRKRSANTSPKEPMPAPHPERRLKRPQTRRAVNAGEASSDVAHEAPAPRRVSARNAHSPSGEQQTNGTVPSFLQSLLDEVELSKVADEAHGPARPSILTNLNPSDHPSPYQSSPAVSPTTSNHPSPRAMSTTPPPLNNSSGPSSPAPLTSKIEPVYSPAPDMTPPRAPSPQSDSGSHRVPRASKAQRRVPRWAQDGSARSVSPPPPRPHSEGPSPRRHGSDVGLATSPVTAASPSAASPNSRLSLEAKTTVQAWVKDALQAPWHAGAVTKAQYVGINKSVSRMLYERIADAARLDPAARDEWRRVAGAEVARAVNEFHGASHSD